VSDVIQAVQKDAQAATNAVVSGAKTGWEIFKNTLGQISADEVLKILAGVAGVALIVLFFFTNWIVADARPYVWQVEVVLWGYALGVGAVGYAKKL